MKTLLELAEIYENWATTNEARAEEILASLDSADDVEDQRWRASQLKADAAVLKERAKELRDLDVGMIEIVQDGYKVPQDREQACDASQATWRYKRLR